MRSMSTKARPFVLEVEQNKPKEEQTVFWIKPKTVESVSESTVRFAKAQRWKKRGQTEMDEKMVKHNEELEWTDMVEKVQNYFIYPDAAGDGYDYFNSKVDTEGVAHLEKQPDGGIRIVETSNDAELIKIFRSLHPDFPEEILKAASELSFVSDEVKND